MLRNEKGRAIMKENIHRSVWINYFNEFTRRNQMDRRAPSKPFLARI